MNRKKKEGGRGGGGRKKERKKIAPIDIECFEPHKGWVENIPTLFFPFTPENLWFSFLFFLQNPYLLALNSSLITLALSRSYLFSYLYLIINLHISGVHPFRDSDIQRVIGLENLFSIETRARSRVRKKEGERERRRALKRSDVIKNWKEGRVEEVREKSDSNYLWLDLERKDLKI